MTVVAPGGPRERGAFAISIDTELAWGSFDRPDRMARFDLERRSREVVHALLELFAAYDISATWALVGHLFLNSCERDGDRVHPELPRPTYAWYPEDWYSRDPGGTADLDSLWLAPDLVGAIAAARPEQEIGCHSFSHLVYGDPGCPKEVAEADLRACVSAASANGLRLTSFVYPRNVVGHVELLAKHGFECYRGQDPAWFTRLPGRHFRRLGHYLDDMLALPPPTVVPRLEHGVWNIAGSMLFQGSDGLRRLIPDRARTRRCLAGIRRAAERRQIFHLWFHPVNFSTRTAAMLRAFEPVLAAVAEARAAGSLDVRTMTGLARELHHGRAHDAQ